jgi:hypothetical protein
MMERWNAARELITGAKTVADVIEVYSQHWCIPAPAVLEAVIAAASQEDLRKLYAWILKSPQVRVYPLLFTYVRDIELIAEIIRDQPPHAVVSLDKLMENPIVPTLPAEVRTELARWASDKKYPEVQQALKVYLQAGNVPVEDLYPMAKSIIADRQYVLPATILSLPDTDEARRSEYLAFYSEWTAHWAKTDQIVKEGAEHRAKFPHLYEQRKPIKMWRGDYGPGNDDL